MDAAMFNMKRPGQVGGPVGMPESMRSQMLSEIGNIDVTAETPYPQPPPHQRQSYSSPVIPQMNQMYYPQQQQQQYLPYQGGGGGGAYPARSYSPVPMMPKRKPMPSSSSRRSSIVSTSSGVNKFFKKGWNKNKDDGFIDDEGLDFDGGEMTFNDLQYIRDRGRYGMNSTTSLDTAPYIPTLTSRPLGTGNGPSGKGKLSNTEYRKQVTAAKKLLYSQAANNGSRALTLQGDPRTMSMQSMGMNDPRSMSLNNSAMAAQQQFLALPPQLGPRAMSLTNLPGQGPRYMMPQQQQQMYAPPPPQQQQQQQMRGSPYMQQPPMFSNGQMRPNSSLDPRAGSDPRLNSMSGSFESVRKSSFLGAAPTSALNSANTSQHSIPEDKNITPVKSRFSPSEEDQVKPAQERVLKKINFNSTTTPEKRQTNIDPSPEKVGGKEESPLKSMTSGYSVSSGEYNPKNPNNQRLYALSDNNTTTANQTQNDVFVTASQFSLQDIQEEDKLHRDETLKGVPVSSKSNKINSHDRTPSVSSGKSNGTVKSKRKSFMKRISFGSSKPKHSEERNLTPVSKIADAKPQLENDDFQYSQPTMGRQIRDFSFGSEKEVLHTAPLYNDDMASSVVSNKSVDELEKPVEKTRQRVPPPPITKDEIPRLNFTVEQLGIMQSNTRLMRELELVSNELAGSISREFELDSQLDLLQKGHSVSTYNGDGKQLRAQSKEISQLISQINEERQKRYIAEEHVLRWENGMKPSLLDLNFKHAELEKKLMKQNENLKEYQSKLQLTTNENLELLLKIEKLQEENNNFKGEIIPNLENQITMLENNNQYQQLENEFHNLKLQNEELRLKNNQVKSIEDQKNALRQALKSMKENYEHELNKANDKIKLLEQHQQKRKSPLRFDYSDESLLSTPTPTRKILPVVYDE